MTKLPLSNIANLQNESTVVTTIATNNAATTAAMEKTLSRDGTSPNQMNADLDMNSHRVLNLVDALDNQEPATFKQVKNFVTAVGQGTVVNAPYITLGNNVNLLNNRVLTPGTNIGFTDTGPVGTLTVAVNDAELNALALTVSAVDTLPYYTGLGTASVTSLPAYGRSLISAIDAATARTTLGSVIGTNVQAWDNDLDAVAGLTTTGLIARTGTGTSSTRTITGTANEITLTNGDGVSGNPTASLPSALTFTGKTVTGGSFSSPSITTPTGIVKADVGLGNVDNTSDATKNSAAVTLTNKTIDTAGGNALKVNGNVLAATAGTATVSIPNSTDTLVGRVTTDTLTNKTLTSPTLTTPVLGTPASGTLTNCTGLPLSGLTTQAAYSFVGNNTGSSAVPTAVTLGGLTAKASPASTDLVLISDQAASGAWKQTTVSALSSAGSVASIGGLTGTIGLGSGLATVGSNIQLDTTMIGEIRWLSFVRAPNSNYKLADGSAVSRTTYATLLSNLIHSSTVTFTNGSANIGWTAHGLTAGEPVKFYNSGGALPTNFTAGTPGTGGTVYYVIATGLTANVFQVSATSGGTAVTAGSAGTGTHTAVNAPWGDGDNSTTFNLPELRGEFLRSWDAGRGINTGRSFGTAESDAMQGHHHIELSGNKFAGLSSGVGYGTGGSWTLSSVNPETGSPITDGTNGTPRTAAETRPRNQTLTAFIRVL